MNGYPDWIPVCDPPKESGHYLVTIESDECTFVSDRAYNVGAGFDMEGFAHIERAKAWMPLPPAYDPPKFGWHPVDEKPKKEGKYLVQLYLPWSKEPVCDVMDYFASGTWNIPSKDARAVRFWSHIEPTPDAR